jgi:hypothetical protein
MRAPAYSHLDEAHFAAWLKQIGLTPVNKTNELRNVQKQIDLQCAQNKLP